MNAKIFNTTILYLFVISFAFFLAVNVSYGLTVLEKNEIISFQESAQKLTGDFASVYDDLVQVFTYETVCTGFYAVEDNGVTIKYTGFGDLKDEYTYTIDKSVVDSIASSTPIKDEKIIIDTIVDTPV